MKTIMRAQFIKKIKFRGGITNFAERNSLPFLSKEFKMSNDPLHGITLERIVTELYEKYGWEELSYHIRINCFIDNPSIKSSLKFLRRTPWARKKVEDLYIYKIVRKRGS